MTDPGFKARDVADSLRKKYMGIAQNDDERMMDAIIKFVYFSQENNSLNAILSDAAKMIHRTTGINEVTIGLKSPTDGLYRYEIILGHTKEAEKSLKNFAYTFDQMRDCKDYPGVPVSKLTEFNIIEAQPFKVGVEEKSYNRPLALRSQRGSIDKMIEGDYIDIYIYGDKDDMIGWIELSNPRDGNFPSRQVIKWLEMISMIIGLAMTKQKLALKRAATQ